MQAVRNGRVILGLATLLWGFLQAPFDHIHPGEDFEHEMAAALVHVHEHATFAGRDARVAEYSPGEDDEIDVLWNAAASPNFVLHADAEPTGRVDIPAPSVASAAIVVPQHRGHDPPEFSPKIPRAPPA
jgi:hypothetical protein